VLTVGLSIVGGASTIDGDGDVLVLNDGQASCSGYVGFPPGYSTFSGVRVSPRNLYTLSGVPRAQDYAQLDINVSLQHEKPCSASSSSLSRFKGVFFQTVGWVIVRIIRVLTITFFFQSRLSPL
jgi:hypothetical protein